MTSILLVEGRSDVDFFAALVRSVGLTGIEIKPPRNFGLRDTVTVFPKLIGDLAKQMENGQVTKLGIVADADRTSGGGVQARWDTLTAALAAFGYNTPAALPELPNMGTVLGNRDGLPPVGLWLMPNHQGDGNLEDFILLSVIGDCTQTDLLDYAQDVTARLPHTLFVYLIPYSRGITTQKPWFIHGWHGSKGQVWV